MQEKRRGKSVYIIYGWCRLDWIPLRVSYFFSSSTDDIFEISTNILCNACGFEKKGE
ncbi:hypothetical protein LINPERPRIM_LOCUS32444 [Linum perenne]